MIWKEGSGGGDIYMREKEMREGFRCGGANKAEESVRNTRGVSA